MLLSALPNGRSRRNNVVRSSSGFTSTFVMENMPPVVPRKLQQWSVHFSNGKWVATIVAPDDRPPWQFPFASQTQAKKFCKAYAPPQLRQGEVCGYCIEAKVRHCRNCGVPICEDCSTRWGIRMVPKTYNSCKTLTVRVCRSCNWLSNAFCLALLQGRHEDVVSLVNTNNVNLRTSFADIHGEALFPVHACVLGGNVKTLQWLVQTHGCPLSVKRDAKNRPVSVQTSAGRTLLDLALKGPKVEILVYLIQQGLNIYNVQDASVIPRALQAILQTGACVPQSVIQQDEVSESTTIGEDSCVLCCAAPMDCVLIPCGHQICCLGCSRQISKCPVCKIACQSLRIFKH